MGKETEPMGTPNSRAVARVWAMARMIKERLDFKEEADTRTLFCCRLDLRDALEALDALGIPKTWEEMEKQQTACGGTVDAAGSNPAGPQGS